MVADVLSLLVDVLLVVVVRNCIVGGCGRCVVLMSVARSIDFLLGLVSTCDLDCGGSGMPCCASSP